MAFSCVHHQHRFRATIGFRARYIPQHVGEITYNSFFDDYPYTALAEAEVEFQDWLHGILGATMAGWLIMVAWLVMIPFRNGERWSWNAITAGIIAWFVLDTGASLAHGVVFNAVFNLGFLFAFGVPLIATYRHFHPRK